MRLMVVARVRGDARWQGTWRQALQRLLPVVDARAENVQVRKHGAQARRRRGGKGLQRRSNLAVVGPAQLSTRLRVCCARSLR